jgi:cell fate regulator YaaT (PSP1 superfamily)
MSVLKVQLESQSRAVYALAPIPYPKGANVIVNIDSMEQLGEVRGRCDCIEPCLNSRKGEVIREATEEDLAKRKEQRAIEEEAFKFCKRTAKDLNLSMRLAKVHHYFDSSKMIFYYTAESRVDFRELVKILARTFKIRIEMRQVGVRDETKICGGIGHCGMQLCCSSHLNEFAPVTVKMAKDQGLTLNPTKISGICGRLMCCLRYEVEAEKDVSQPEENENGEPISKGVKDE